MKNNALKQTKLRHKTSVLGWALLLTGLSFSSAQAAEGVLALYDVAMQQDAQLQAAKATYEAEVLIKEQALAVLLPQIAVQASYQHNDYSKPVPQAMTEVSQQSLILSQSLFDASSWSRYEQAKLLSEQSGIRYQLAEQDLLLRVSQAYFSVLRAEYLQQAALAQQGAIEQQKTQVQAGVDVGLTNPMDLLEVQARYDAVEADLMLADNQLAIASAELSRLIARPLPALKKMQLSTQLPTLKTSPDEASLAHNLQHRHQAYQLATAEQEVSAQRAGHYPTLKLQASVAQQQNELADRQSPIVMPNDYQHTQVGVVLHMPLYSGGATSTQVNQAQANQRAAAQQLRLTEEQIRLDVLNLSNTIAMSAKRLHALRQSVASNEAFLLAAEESHRVGFKNLVDVLNARALLYQAQQALANALFDDVQQRFQLQASLGELNRDSLQAIDAYLHD